MGLARSTTRLTGTTGAIEAIINNSSEFGPAEGDYITYGVLSGGDFIKIGVTATLQLFINYNDEVIVTTDASLSMDTFTHIFINGNGVGIGWDIYVGGLLQAVTLTGTAAKAGTWFDDLIGYGVCQLELFSPYSSVIDQLAIYQNPLLPARILAHADALSSAGLGGEITYPARLPFPPIPAPPITSGYTIDNTLLGDDSASYVGGGGIALSTDKTVLVVGVDDWDGLAGGGQGAVFVYDWSGGAWVQRGSEITASDAGSADAFGSSVALSSDKTQLFVGARNWDGPAGSNQGAVYIFDWNGSAWVEQVGVVTASVPGSYFAGSMVVSDDDLVMAVGGTGAGSNKGAVYIFDWSGSAWVYRGTITAGDGEAGDWFGASVAISSDKTVLAVGASGWDSTSSRAGAVYTFDWSGSSWGQRGSVLTVVDERKESRFGVSLSMNSAGTFLASGCFVRTTGNFLDIGAVALFDVNGSSWDQRADLLQAAWPRDEFGYRMAAKTDGSTFAIGSRSWRAPNLEDVVGAVHTISAI